MSDNDETKQQFAIMYASHVLVLISKITTSIHLCDCITERINLYRNDQ